MTDATSSMPMPRIQRSERLSLPATVPFDAPVLIADAVSPLAGETVLSLLWKRLEKPGDQP